MKTSFYLLLGTVLCLFLSACKTTSVHPLSSPKTAQIDPRLLGDWYGKDEQDTFHFTATKGAWIHVVITPKQADTGRRSKRSDAKPESYDLFPTVIGKYTYLNVVLIDESNEADDDDTDVDGPDKSYAFLRYTVSGNVLQMWMMSQDAAADAVRAGKVRGRVHTDKDDLVEGNPPHPDVDVYLKDSSENLFNFIQGSDVKKLFNDKMETLYRMQPSGK